MDDLEIILLAYVALPIIGVFIGSMALAVTYGRSINPRSKIYVIAVSSILIASAVGGVIVASNEDQQSSRIPFVVPMNSGPNLLLNPSFENGTAGLANDWHKEYDSSALFSLVTYGVVTGVYAQRISKTGTNMDHNALVEIYQSPQLYNYSSGEVFIFSVYISGSITKCSGLIGIEGFGNSDQWISEEDVYLSGLTDTPQIFGVSYQVPVNCSELATYVQFNEINSVSSLSITIDNASLVRVFT